eukprot:1038083-Amphidinium_carterae.2
MLACRAKHCEKQHMRWMMTDSSTQHGRTFQLSAVIAIECEAIGAALSAANGLVFLWCITNKDGSVLASKTLQKVYTNELAKRNMAALFQQHSNHDQWGVVLCQRHGTSPEDPDAFELDHRYVELLQSAIQYHMLAPIMLGVGSARVVDKFHAVMHSFFLEAGTSKSSLASYCAQMKTLTTDLGTEVILPRVQPVAISSLFPWMQSDHKTGATFVSEDAMDDLSFLASASASIDEPEVSLVGALGIPGMLHIVHNAAADMLKVTPSLDEQIDALSQLHGKLRRFQHRVYRGRWGTIAFACEAMLALKPVLSFGWSLPKYTEGMLSVSQELIAINEALLSDYFWGSMYVLSKLYALVRASFAWCEGCSCHSHMDLTAVSTEVRDRWQRCPMRGLRLPEVCAGDFFGVMDTLGNETNVAMLQELPPGLSSQQRSCLLREFQQGRSHLMYSYTVKLGAFTIPPLLVGAVAHHKTAVAKEALRRIMQVESPDPTIEPLFAEPLHIEVKRFLDGVDLQELVHLQQYVAAFRFAPIVERRVEGSHAVVQRKGRGATIRHEAYDSLSLRMPEIIAHLQASPVALEQLSVHLDLGRSPKQMIHQLGLESHPAAMELETNEDHAWCRGWRKIAYRSDVHTLYHSPKLHLQITETAQRAELAQLASDENLSVESVANAEDSLNTAYDVLLRE